MHLSRSTCVHIGRKRKGGDETSAADQREYIGHRKDIHRSPTLKSSQRTELEVTAARRSLIKDRGEDAMSARRSIRNWSSKFRINVA